VAGDIAAQRQHSGGVLVDHRALTIMQLLHPGAKAALNIQF
jgi:hypothetical protein